MFISAFGANGKPPHSFWHGYISCTLSPSVKVRAVARPIGTLWMPLGIRGDVYKTGRALCGREHWQCHLWLNHFNSTCSHTLLAIYTGLRKIAAILLAISTTGLSRQSSRTRLGEKTRSINPRALWCSSRWPLPLGGLGCHSSSTCNGNTSILYSTADFSS